MEFSISQREREGIALVDLDGRLQLGEPASSMRSYLEQLSASGQNRVVLNLAEVAYIDSTGLGTLVVIANQLKQAGGAMKLVNLNRRNIELMIMTKLSTVFEIFNDETDAVNSFFPDRKIQKFDILEFIQKQEPESE